MTMKAHLATLNLAEIRSVQIEGGVWYQVADSFAIKGDVVTFTPVLSAKIMQQIGGCGTIQLGIDRIVSIHTLPKKA